MLTYKIATGQLWLDGELIGQGYAGNGQWLNDPDSCNVKMHGPLPQGLYSIESPQDLPQSVGLFAMRLDPDPTNEMFGRGGFFIHGDNGSMNHTASDGCIVTQRSTRNTVAAAVECCNNRLQVIA